MKDYLAVRTLEPGDKLDHGVKGMKWGVRKAEAAAGATVSTGKKIAKEVVDAPAAMIRVQAKTYNATIKDMNNKHLPALSASEKYAGKDLRKDKNLAKEYEKDAQALFHATLTAKARNYNLTTTVLKGAVVLTSLYLGLGLVGPIAGLAVSTTRNMLGKTDVDPNFEPPNFGNPDSLLHADGPKIEIFKFPLVLNELGHISSMGEVEHIAMEGGEMEHSDYLANRTVQDGDKLDHGIKGMKWGVRRSSKQLAADTASRKASGEEVTKTAKSEKVTVSSSGSSGSTSTPAETAQARYSRLTAQAKASGAQSLSDQDLKFYNARTEAVSKVNKLHKKKDGWLKEAAREVAQNSAKKAMQEISNTVVDKYITSPIKDKVRGELKEQAGKKALAAAAKAAKK